MLQKRWHFLEKRFQILRKMWPIINYKLQKFYRKIKYAIPMYRSLYSGIRDIFFPNRYALIVPTYALVHVCGYILYAHTRIHTHTPS